MWFVKKIPYDANSFLYIRMLLLIIVRVCYSLRQVVKIDGRIIGDGHVGPVTQRLQSAFTKLTEESGVPIPTYRKA